MEKQAESTGVPYADSAVTQASMASVPTIAVGNKPAPGQTGPKGMAPRTNYSRVNAGSSPPTDLGASTQKSLSPDSQSFLPHKVAHPEVHMSAVTPTMTIHDLVKAAAAGVADRVAATQEAERQTVTPVQATKVASATEDSIPTAYIDKLAEAMEFVVKEASPGEGPNALVVTDSHIGGKNPFTPGSQGQATPAHVVPKDPGLHTPSEVSKGPANALADNASMKHPAQPTKLSSVTTDELRKAASAVKVAAKEEPAKEVCKGCGKEKDACSCSKTASAVGAVNPKLVDLFLSTVKLAEDAINPAKISAGAAVAPETSASGQAGGAPAGGMPKGNTSLISSNDSAINYTKRDAKAGTSAAMGKLLTEPALSAAHDKTLGMAFASTPKAGVKIAGADPIRTAAARVVLEKMAAEAEEDAKKKKKESGGGFTAPPVGGVAGSAGGM
jgi:hypothetical protein